MPTRSLTLLAVAVLFGSALVLTTRTAHGLEAPESKDPVSELQKQVDSLRADVELLRRRERAITEYLVALGKAADHLKSTTQAARIAGFEMAAIPADSRIALLRGIDQLSDDLGRGLPSPSRDDAALAKKADDLRKGLK